MTIAATDDSMQEIAAAQRDDPALQQFWQHARGRSAEFHVRSGQLNRIDDENEQLVIPDRYRK